MTIQDEAVSAWSPIECQIFPQNSQTFSLNSKPLTRTGRTTRTRTNQTPHRIHYRLDGTQRWRLIYRIARCRRFDLAIEATQGLKLLMRNQSHQAILTTKGFVCWEASLDQRLTQLTAFIARLVICILVSSELLLGFRPYIS